MHVASTGGPSRPKIEGTTPLARQRKAPSLATLRSAITNGSQLLAGCDHRTARMRRLRDLIGAHLSDLGGVDNCSQAEMSIVRRAALLTLELEVMESKFEHEGEASPKQLDAYQRAANSLRRLLESLGLRRRPKNITPPHPLDYARAFDQRKAATT
jgi:hypothetical protein